jgi:imidazolonepropionase-like amidohydrolase
MLRALWLAADTLRYVVLTQGIPSGSQVVIRESPSVSRIAYEFNDRGRGPKIEARVEVDPKGLPRAVSISGVDYLKQPVDERLTSTGATLGWRGGSEQGRSDRPGFFLPLESAPEIRAILVRALLESPARRLPILPTGEARLEEVERRTVSAGGATRRVIHYAISGLSFQPDDIWLEPDGTLFAEVGGWFRTIRAGFESTGDLLQSAQDSASVRRARALAVRLADRPRGAIAFVHATLFDAPNARTLSDQTVVVEGNRIRAVGPAAATRPPAGARIVDARGKTVLPGLWDMHAHLGETDGLLDMAAGVTSVRDMANDTDYLLATRKSYDAGTAIGPRVAVMAGFMDGPGPFHGPTKVLVSTVDSAVRWVDRYADLGYEHIKLYSSLDPALVRPIAERAHALGLRVSGHIPRGMVARQAVEAGYDEVQHTNMLFLNFLGDTLDTRTPLRFTTVARFGADLDLASDSVRAFLRFLKERKTVIDPTLATFEEMFLGAPGGMTEGNRRIAGRLPSQVQRGMLGGGLPGDDAARARYRASYRRMIGMVKALYDEGIPIVAGTDCTAGFCLHRELELYVEAGIPNAEVLRIATWGAAQVARRTDRLGSLEPGKLADLIVVAGDPMARIEEIRRVDLVMKDGVVYDPAALYAALGVKPWRSARPAP